MTFQFCTLNLKHMVPLSHKVQVNRMFRNKTQSTIT